MNITEYRAMKAQEAQEQQQVDSQSKGEQPNVQVEPTAVTSDEQPNQTQGTESTVPNQTGEQGETPTQSSATETPEPTLPQTIEIDGVDVPIDELRNGYLRQRDYTQKTQALAKEKKQVEIATQYYQAIQNNPDLAKKMAETYNLPYLTPEQAKVQELEEKYQDLLLEREVSSLQAKYNDFDAQEVLQYAFDHKIENLEDAYVLVNSRKQASTPADAIPDVNTLKEQIRQELLAELQSNVDTSSIIQSGGDVAPVKDDAPRLSQQEIKIAKNMRMTPEEYAKWRDKR